MRRIGAALFFALRSAGQNFRRNMAVSIAGVFTMGLILFLVGGLLLLTHSIDRILADQEAKSSNIKIYLQDGVSLTTITDYESQLAHDPRVVSVSLETKDQAADQFRHLSSDLGSALDTLANPLPASLNVQTRSLSDLRAIDAEARQNPIVDTKNSSDYNDLVISRLNGLIRGITLGGLVLVLVLSFISLVIIMNTIRTAVFLRRTEIEIMKLVGATDWFVRWPFILEGALGGILAAAFASVAVTAAYRVLLKARLADVVIFTYDNGYLPSLVSLLFGVGILLGAFGSYLGVRRFLTV